MARNYHVDIARYASGAPAKWIDNLLSRFDVPGTSGGRQGIARRMSTLGVYHIVLIWRLARDLNLPMTDAVSVAAGLLAANTASLAVSDRIALRLDRDAFGRDVDQSIAEAVETVVPARRGRPPKRRIS